jgi:ribonuclease P protein component
MEHLGSANPMLKRANRLAKSKDIASAFARGRTFFNPFFAIRFLPKPAEKRFTVVVSTKVYKRAVDRNRLKRLVREYLRKNLPSFKNGSYVIAAKPKISKLPEKDIVRYFLDAAGRIR